MNPQQTQPNTQDGGISALADAVTRGLAYTENGGAPNIENPSAGKTGEMKSIFQYEPETWKSDAGKVLGDPNTPLTPDNETYVTRQLVAKDLQNGMTVSQIASSWNAGPGEPDAYTGKFSDGSPSVGVNEKYGVKYDVPGYAKKVLAYTKQFLQGGGSEQTSQTPSQPSQSQTAQPSPLQSNPPLKKAITMLQKANKGKAQQKSSSGLMGRFAAKNNAKQTS